MATNNAKSIWRPYLENATGSTQNARTEDPVEPLAHLLEWYPENIRDLIAANWPRIRTHNHESKRVQDRYNIRLSAGFTLEDIPTELESIARRQDFKFKTNLCLGFILQHTVTKQLTFYYASNNTKLFQRPLLIASLSDVETAGQQLDAIDFMTYCFNQRPNSNYVVRAVTNVLFYVDKMKPYRFGRPIQIRPAVKKLGCLVTFAADKHGKTYDDNLCFFRCLQYMKDGTNDESAVKLLLNKFQDYHGRTEAEYSGVSWTDLKAAEDCFDVIIDVFTLCEDENGKLYAKKLRSSLRKHGCSLNLHAEQQHFCYIKKIQTYCSCWQCRKCKRYFGRRYDCTRHENNCSELTKFRYPGGGFGKKPDIFDLLTDAGINVPNQDRFYPYRIAYDFEAAFTQDGVSEHSGTVSRLEPVSVSVCSNVPGHTEPVCFVADNGCYDLVKEMIAYMQKVSASAAEVMTKRFSVAIEQMEQLVQENSSRLDMNSRTLSHIARIQKNFERWLTQIVVLGFNSSKFDLNLIRQYFFPTLLEMNEEVYSFIKKGNQYVSISTNNMLFLDIRNYVAPTTSYASWLKSNDVKEEKSVFPYEWLTSIEKLQIQGLVEHKYFYSNLKKSNISEEEYSSLCKTWESEGFNTMRDLLVFYNNRDVKPFLEAADKLYKTWQKLNIDPFKGPGISLPGLALAHLVNTMPLHIIIPLFPEHHKEIYHKIRDNITGGLSIVFHRYHEQDKTKLPNGEPCRVVYSHDANSLYLWALAQPTGTGIYVYWHATDCGSDALQYRFSGGVEAQNEWKRITESNMRVALGKSYADKYHKLEIEWLEWMSHTMNKRIVHQYNGGQHVIRKDQKTWYSVDGFIRESRTVLQFHGCRFHGHMCHLDNVKSVSKREATDQITAFLKSKNYNVIQMWECRWEERKNRDPILRKFIAEHVTMQIEDNMTAGKLIGMIQRESFFGLVECDIEVPVWNDELMEYFRDFPPICKNALVGIDDIGPFMKKYAEEHGLLSKPRKTLVSSYFGKKILLATPFIKWCLQKGLVISRVYSAVQMKPKDCFSHLADEVAHHRRQADKNPAHKAEGEAWKLKGNNYYGKTITDKKRHKDWSVVGEEDVHKKVNDPRFCELTELNESTYEIAMDKKNINFDLPVSIAYFVYNYAKLRVLEFVYDFLKEYLLPGSYQLVCSDTDSIIAAYQSENMDDLVIPAKLHEYIRNKHRFLVDETDGGYSKRTPGLFKIELSAKGIVAMCPKTYLAWNETDTEKVSCKGLNKNINQFSKDDFMKVLETGVRGSGVNTGFRVYGNGLYQYEQRRHGLSYLYIKRKVLCDGISTAPLDI